MRGLLLENLAVDGYFTALREAIMVQRQAASVSIEDLERELSTGLAEVILDITGYPIKDSEHNLSMADIKLAEILAVLRNRYGLEREEGFPFEANWNIRSLSAHLAKQVMAKRRET